MEKYLKPYTRNRLQKVLPEQFFLFLMAYFYKMQKL